MNQARDPLAVSRELLKLLRRSRQYYEQLQRLAREQRALIQADDAEELLSLLAERQKVVRAIGRTHQELAPYQKEWDQLKERLPAEVRTEIQGLLGDLQDMLNGLLEHDRQDCAELVARKQQIADELSVAAKGRAASAAYAGAMTRRAGAPAAGRSLEISG